MHPCQSPFISSNPYSYAGLAQHGKPNLFAYLLPDITSFHLSVILCRTCNRQRTTGNRQQAAGNRQQATGNRQQANRQQATGNRQQVTSNRQQAIDNRQQAIGKRQ